MYLTGGFPLNSSTIHALSFWFIEVAVGRVSFALKWVSFNADTFSPKE